MTSAGAGTIRQSDMTLLLRLIFFEPLDSGIFFLGCCRCFIVAFSYAFAFTSAVQLGKMVSLLISIVPNHLGFVVCGVSCFVLQKNHIFTAKLNAAVVRGVLRSEKPELLTVIFALKHQSEAYPKECRTFAVEASITGFNHDQGWFISKCSAASCPRTVMPSGNQWACARDGKITFPKLLYRVGCDLSDNTGSIPVIMFDEGAKKLAGCDCKDLVMHEGYNDASILPPVLLQCRGQQKNFHLRLLLGSHQNVTTFTVENITPIPPLTIAPTVDSIIPTTPMQPPQTHVTTPDSMTPMTPMQPPQTHAAPPATSTAAKRNLQDALVSVRGARDPVREKLASHAKEINHRGPAACFFSQPMLPVNFVYRDGLFIPSLAHYR
ncbi:hypothetical protein SSX86_003011 [Deinandra increscens subsp. villosa]|uniref:Replication factor A C-terminal domain-containing protein n=1 Tax=Deinandra increscens subsp. villosa TaxID=3103831 RepID=A0AAP0DPE5_9ASTR